MKKKDIFQNFHRSFDGSWWRVYQDGRPKKLYGKFHMLPQYLQKALGDIERKAPTPEDVNYYKKINNIMQLELFRKENGINIDMIKAGELFMSEVINAQVSYKMGGLGGSKTWEEYLEYKKDYIHLDLVKKTTIEPDISTVEALYIVMKQYENKNPSIKK